MAYISDGLGRAVGMSENCGWGQVVMVEIGLTLLSKSGGPVRAVPPGPAWFRQPCLVLSF